MRKAITVSVFAAVLVAFASDALADEPVRMSEGIGEQFLKTVVSIETIDQKGNATPVGTGFIVRHPSELVALFTAKHVVHDTIGNLRSNLGYRLNSKSGTSILVPDAHASKHAGPWFVSDNHDVAFRFIVFDPNESDYATIPLDMILPADHVRPGASVLVAGFPLGLRSEEHAVAIVRGGIVARPDQAKLLVDSFTFPGNSGGPVFYVPTIKTDGKFLKSPFINTEKLLGLVSRQISYTEAAISPQTGRPRITFEDNSGLTIVVPADQITQLFARADVKAIVRTLRPDRKKNEQEN